MPTDATWLYFQQLGGDMLIAMVIKKAQVGVHDSVAAQAVGNVTAMAVVRMLVITDKDGDAANVTIADVTQSISTWQAGRQGAPRG